MGIGYWDCLTPSNFGHILVRYYYKNTGGDVDIESGSEKDSIYNEIKINNSLKKDF